MPPKILNLTLMKKWFDLVLSGEKKEEYREIKDYWTKRLFNSDGTPKKYDFIVFRNGYSKDAPMMKIEFKGIKFSEFEGKKVYALQLGEIVEIGNVR